MTDQEYVELKLNIIDRKLDVLLTFTIAMLPTRELKNHYEAAIERINRETLEETKHLRAKNEKG